ncbi:MAG: hypothetical protein H7Z41_19475 [Cytophagales bacterium]|nr:hypothetical protein [Armatimonadota bacterium]
MSKKNRFAEAFKENFNLVGLAGAVALSAATLNPLPLIAVAIAEAAYLLFVPDSRWYDSRLAKRFDAEVDARREALKKQIFPYMSGAMQERFTRLEAIRVQIASQPPGSSGGGDDKWFREVVRKLDYLLEKFLTFAQKEAQFRAYLQSVHEQVGRDRGGPTARPPMPHRPQQRPVSQGGGEVMPADFDLFDAPRERRGRQDLPRRGETFVVVGEGADEQHPRSLSPRLADRWTQETVKTVQAHYHEEITGVNAALEEEDDLNTKAILTKRAEVLQQRGEYVGKIGKILTNLGHQMELLEDSFGLINDQMRARSPDQVLADIEGVVYQTDSMTKLLEELAPYEQDAERLAA